ncbi:MAG TPA: tripartite tricarboxylate transporter substrate binding protein [Ramlibacter sp.]|uniref:Bug family tripartite tricarboxylate transporter substrate binding protein n=1 Tax=Ramlibacter sp. TaxID=1917967 RepID=UPI002C53956A|nr:tripartite tricarboxylate transporter substrate binding protein [Ramlibacter sp.]HVZ44923.1 tripartite tricarboxylate transporter substrate binding protein [Ramlibacter sp.]
MRAFRIAAALVAAILFAAPAAAAAAYPDRPVKIIVPFAPGGGTDVIARVLAQRLGAMLGQTFLVENRPGGGAMIGADAVARSSPDGYTLLLGSNSELTISPSLYGHAPYDPATAFEPIALLGTSPAILVANLRYPGNTLPDVIAAARARPNSLTFGSGGVGTPPALAGELLKYMQKLQAVHVPYKGGGPLQVALLGGEVEVGFTTIASTRAQLKSHQVKALAVIAARRSPLVPDVPSAAEQGIADYEVATWYGLFAPAQVPREVADALRAATARAMADPEMLSRLDALGVEPGAAGQGGASLRERIRTESAKWGDLIRAAGLKAE